MCNNQKIGWWDEETRRGVWVTSSADGKTGEYRKMLPTILALT